MWRESNEYKLPEIFIVSGDIVLIRPVGEKAKTVVKQDADQILLAEFSNIGSLAQ